MQNHEYNFSIFEQHVNLFNLGLSALLNPEQGEQLSDEEKIEALKTQIENYENAIADLNRPRSVQQRIVEADYELL